MQLKTILHKKKKKKEKKRKEKSTTYGEYFCHKDFKSMIIKAVLLVSLSSESVPIFY
jgi:ribosomal protein L34E